MAVEIAFGIATTLIGELRKVIERTKNAEQEEKNKLRQALQHIEASLDQAIIKIGLCARYEGDYYSPKELQLYIPSIALNINEVANATKDIFPREIYDGLINLANQFVSFNREINSLEMGKDFHPNLKKLLDAINKLKGLLSSVGSEK